MIFQITIRNQKSCWYVDSQYGSKESPSQHDLKTELGPVSDWIKHNHAQIKYQSSNPAKFADLCWGKNRRPALRFHPKHSLSCLSSLKTKVWVLMWNEQEKKKATHIISAQRIFASPYKILSEILWSQVIETFRQQLNKFSSVSFALKQNTDFVSNKTNLCLNLHEASLCVKWKPGKRKFHFNLVGNPTSACHIHKAKEHHKPDSMLLGCCFPVVREISQIYLFVTSKM